MYMTDVGAGWEVGKFPNHMVLQLKLTTVAAHTKVIKNTSGNLRFPPFCSGTIDRGSVRPHALSSMCDT